MDTIQPQPFPLEEKALDLRTNPFQEGGDDGRGPSTPFHEWQETSQKRLDPKARASRPSKTKLGASKTKLEASKTKLGASRTKLRASRTRILGSSYEWKRGY